MAEGEGGMPLGVDSREGWSPFIAHNPSEKEAACAVKGRTRAKAAALKPVEWQRQFALC